MKFRPIKIKGKIFQDSVESAEGYVIHRCVANGVPTGRILAFYGRTTARSSPIVVGGYDNSEEAREACIHDWIARQK